MEIDMARFGLDRVVSMTTWCLLHQTHKVEVDFRLPFVQQLQALDRVECLECRLKVRDQLFRERAQLAEHIALKGRCTFCGGPTPCTRED